MVLLEQRPVHFGPNRDGVCQHTGMTLHPLRMALLRAQATCNFSTLPQAIAEAEARNLTRAETVSLGAFKASSGWWRREITTDNAVALLRRAAEARLALGGPRSQTVAVELTGVAIIMRAYDGHEMLARTLYGGLAPMVSDPDPITEAVMNIAGARILFRFEGPAKALPTLQRVYDVALELGDVCAIDMAAQHLAAVYAAAGQQQEVLRVFTEANIPFHMIPPFWIDPDVLATELRWHSYVRG